MRREVRLLLSAENSWLLGEGLLGPLFAVFTQRIGGELLDIAWTWATYLLFTGLFIIIVGKVSDHAGKEWLLVWGFGLNAVFTFEYLLVRTPSDLLLVQIGLALAAALATPTWDALYSRYQGEHESGYLWGMHSGQANIVTGVAVLLGGSIVSGLSFTALFVIMGTLQVIATLFVMPLVKAAWWKRRGALRGE